GWQGAFVAAAMIGLIVAAPLAAQPAALFTPPPQPVRPASEAPKDGKSGWSLLLSGPILLNLLFFVMITFSTTGVQSYAVVALNEAFGTPIGVANTALTVNLLLSAAGVLAGGLLAARLGQPEWIAAGCFLGIAVTGAVIGLVDLSFAAL